MTIRTSIIIINIMYYYHHHIDLQPQKFWPTVQPTYKHSTGLCNKLFLFEEESLLPCKGENESAIKRDCKLVCTDCIC